MAHPAGGRLLEGKVAGLRAAGVGVLVSLQTDSERVECDLQDEERVVRAAGIQYLCFPIPDRTVPSVDAAEVVVRRVHDAYLSGAHVVFHCWAGVGRSSLMAGMLLGLEGVAPEEAWRLLGEARGRAVPDTAEQADWLDAWWVSRGTSGS
ncbi:hypothetical protein [Lentzea sp. NBRC 102530]|uniref:protein-tyrosine phosphatase family protein n=1 Tax=Lentzea sp. NBRC 102530 TaxID=3032201 RepID=UPI0024A381FE|nr:hypothetical protein Lesp01_18970 [Lentzea sp. NBRC 102530]